jgi:hypothetical protein
MAAKALTWRGSGSRLQASRERHEVVQAQQRLGRSGPEDQNLLRLTRNRQASAVVAEAIGQPLQTGWAGSAVGGSAIGDAAAGPVVSTSSAAFASGDANVHASIKARAASVAKRPAGSAGL